MKKKYNNLNEELLRMKSLFTEERLYGNLVETVLETKTLITEQKGKRQVFQSLKRAFSLGLKNIDPKILTNFMNFKIVDLGDFAKHLDEFSNVWAGAIIPGHVNFDGMTKLVSSIDAKIKADPEWIKKIPYEKWVDIARMFPKEGGVQETVINMMLEAAGKTTKTIDDVNIGKIDIVKSGDEVVITTTKGTEVKQYKKNSSTEFVDVKDGNTVYKDDAVNPVNQKSTDELLSDINTSLTKDVPEGATMKEMDGKTYENTPENQKKIEESVGEELSEEGGIVTQESIKNNELLEEQIAETKEILEELKVEKQRLADEKALANEKELQELKIKEKEIELKIQEEKTKQKKLEETKQKPKEKQQEVSITEKQKSWIKRKLADIGLTEEFWEKYIAPIFIARQKPTDSKFGRHFKAGVSSIVDPLGFFRWFNKKYPVTARDIKYTSGGSKFLMTTVVRMVGGSAANIIFWNFIMYRLFEDPKYAIKFTGDNIFKTYWNNLKDNYVTKKCKDLLGYYWDQIKQTCDDIKKKSGKDCEQWLNDWRDEIPQMSKDYLDKKNCAEIKGMIDEYGNVKPEAIDGLATYCHSNYNKRLRDSYDLNIVEEILEFFTDYEGPITDIAKESFLNAGVDNPDEDSLADIIMARKVECALEDFKNEKEIDNSEKTVILIDPSDTTNNQIKL